MIFETRGVSYRYPSVVGEAVRDVTLSIAAGELVGIVGPNGSGKTTLLRLLLGVLRPLAGEVLVAGRSAASWKRRELARLVGVVSQREEPAFPLRVREAVLFGRYPHLGPLGAPRGHDLAAVEQALERCDVGHIRDRWIATLSGGEWQRVRIARALAQAPKALVLDEPTANLDIRHEMEVLELVAELVRDQGLAGVLVTHHVNLAARFVDRIVVMVEGAARAVGRPEEVLQGGVLEEVFRWPVALSPWQGVPQVIPLRRWEQRET
ncbi:MAG: ATP-binding cassette domain-containing protein [Gemmatimonadales bacterium]|nr:ATP-binding cassette domain-containing protein [Gemmatimonadales bacterium]NIR01399.1 ATP-binding cassette domain-containing protein [Gemmatimonadales bacterium]NIS65301.1 ATP-binding cassette domain-containing protein [Gemmatimonadales bacterium]